MATVDHDKVVRLVRKRTAAEPAARVAGGEETRSATTMKARRDARND
jgi:hypothetical protein